MSEPYLKNSFYFYDKDGSLIVRNQKILFYLPRLWRMRCQSCGKRRIVYVVGIRLFCKKCIFTLVKERGVRKKIDVKLAPKDSESLKTCYAYVKGNTIFLCDVGENKIISTINHESLHYTLEKLFNALLSEQFDCIDLDNEISKVEE